jgi:cellulose synthase/poly-beta-1,6-N-acetylglucosamine synthase-like glycosyltransferase
MNIYIIIPFHNEEKYIESTIKSIIEQSYPVKKLLLINDNSNDQSCSKIKSYVDKYDWISRIDINSSNKHLPGKKVVNAFNHGLKSLDSNYDIICKFDADIILPKNYLDKIVLEYKKDPLVGMVSGILHIKKKNIWVFEKVSSKKHVRGPIKSYNKECFKNIGGLRESIGWDTVDVLLAKYNNWKVITNENLIVKHLKPTGLNYNKKAKYLQGEALYKMRFGIILSLLSALKRSYNLKSVSYLIFIIIGYLNSIFNNKERIVNKTEGGFIRKLTWGNIYKKLLKR